MLARCCLDHRGNRRQSVSFQAVVNENKSAPLGPGRLTLGDQLLSGPACFRNNFPDLVVRLERFDGFLVLTSGLEQEARSREVWVGPTAGQR